VIALAQHRQAALNRGAERQGGAARLLDLRCINCIHIIPDLKKLEKKYPNELVVIGVHSAKFETKKNLENIRRIILRYEIEHPIVTTPTLTFWRSYAVDAWPTRYLIDPAGYIIGRLSGEGGYEALDRRLPNRSPIFGSGAS